MHIFEGHIFGEVNHEIYISTTLFNSFSNFKLKSVFFQEIQFFIWFTPLVNKNGIRLSSWTFCSIKYQYPGTFLTKFWREKNNSKFWPLCPLLYTIDCENGHIHVYLDQVHWPLTFSGSRPKSNQFIYSWWCTPVPSLMKIHPGVLEILR